MWWWKIIIQLLASKDNVNPLSANPKKWSNTLKQFVGNLPTNCLTVFDHFVNLTFKSLILSKQVRRSRSVTFWHHASNGKNEELLWSLPLRRLFATKLYSLFIHVIRPSRRKCNKVLLTFQCSNFALSLTSLKHGAKTLQQVPVQSAEAFAQQI